MSYYLLDNVKVSTTKLINKSLINCLQVYLYTFCNFTCPHTFFQPIGCVMYVYKWLIVLMCLCMRCVCGWVGVKCELAPYYLRFRFGIESLALMLI